MRDFSKINPSLWSSSRFNNLNENGKLFYLYCLSAPQSNSCGCYRLPIGYAMEDLKWEKEQVISTIDTVSKTKLIRYHHEESVVYVDRWYEYNSPNNPKHCLRVISELLSVPKSPLRSLNANDLKRFIDTRPWDKSNVLSKLKPLISHTVSYTVSRLGDTETKTKTETKTETKTDKRKTIKKKKVSLEDLSINHISDWLTEKRVNGKYHGIDENRLLEMFKDYCLCKNPDYKDYVAALRNAFEWNNAPRIGENKNGQFKTKSELADEAVSRGLAQILEPEPKRVEPAQDANIPSCPSKL